MQAALRLKTTVLPGQRIEFAAPELPEGTNVEVIVLPELTMPMSLETKQYASAQEYLDSLPPIQRTPEEWEQIEREFREEREAWDR
jgi:hypothetical protein